MIATGTRDALELAVPESRSAPSERHWDDGAQMVGVEDVLERILAAVSPLPARQLPILDALGLVLAEDVIADVDVPPFRNSAMDGYAVRAIDTIGASIERPVSLRVIGSLAAGAMPTAEVRDGTVIRIMTGAPLPEGADTVVRFEQTNQGRCHHTIDAPQSAFVAVTSAVRPLENVRPAGEDVAKGTTALTAGTRLRPPEIGLLAALNRAEVAVHPRPSVAILSTGDEIAKVGPSLRPGQIRGANTYLLSTMVRSWGGEAIRCGISSDAPDDVRRRLATARNADLVVTSGGVSHGDYDTVKQVLRYEGTIDIWQVRMKPGKALASGTLGSTPFLGLPGNPVAAAVSFTQFGRPAILKMLGRRDLIMPTIEATSVERIVNDGRRRHFVRAIVDGTARDGYTVRVAGDQGAGVMTSLVRANGLLVIPEDVEVVEPGMRVSVQMTDWDGE